MATYVSVLNPSTNNVEGHQKWLGGLYSAGVATHIATSQLQVVQRGAGANLSVDVSIGQCILALPSGLVSYWAWTDAATNVAIATADATNPRIDTIVAWVDQTVASSSTTNSLGALKFMSVAGTAAGSPVAVTDATIQTAVGASSAWIKLATVTVAAGTVTVTNAVITDARTALAPLAPVTATAILPSAITLGYAQITSNFATANQTPILVTGLSVTVNIPNGGRKIRVSFFTSDGYSNAANSLTIITLWDGTVGSGTAISRALINPRGNDNLSIPMYCAAILAPSAGTKTYSVGLHTNANTSTIEAAPTYPSYILVEAI